MSERRKTFLTNSGKPLPLGKLIGKGGEAVVFEIMGSPDLAVKIYLEGKAPDRRAKIMEAVSAGLRHRSEDVAFPIEEVFDSRGNFSGFVMKKFDRASPIHQLWDRRDRQEKFPTADVRFIVRVATNVAMMVADLHRSGCVIGDINESDFLVTDSATVVLIDSDSFQYAIGSTVFPCIVGTPQFIPPEHQGKSQRTLGWRSPNHDCFGLAVIIFRLLMGGAHPFMGVWKGKDDPPSIKERIAEFRYAYGSDCDQMGVGPQPTAPPVTWLTAEIRGAFDLAFGTYGPLRRPRAQDWICMLANLEAKLVQCPRSKFHHFQSGDSECPWCISDKTRIHSHFSGLCKRQGKEEAGSLPRTPGKPPQESNNNSSSEKWFWRLVAILLFGLFLFFFASLKSNEELSGQPADIIDNRGSNVLATISSSCASDISLRFFETFPRSQVLPSSRRWPPGGENWYILSPGSNFNLTLRCSPGYFICYGASRFDGYYWGVGVHGRYGCENCCSICPESGNNPLDFFLTC